MHTFHFCIYFSKQRTVQLASRLLTTKFATKLKFQVYTAISFCPEIALNVHLTLIQLTLTLTLVTVAIVTTATLLSG